MIWGQVLDAKPHALLRLHWSLIKGSAPYKPTEKYRPAESNYDLPEAFWLDLSDVFSLVASRQAAVVKANRGNVVVSELTAFIERVRKFIAVGSFDSTHEALMQFVLADALLTLGRQSNDSPALIESIGAYRKALNARPRARGPEDWATTQNNLGIALSVLGERDAGTERLTLPLESVPHNRVTN